MKKFLAVICVLMLLVGTSSIALADGCPFYGYYTSYFQLSRTWNKVNDRTLEISIADIDYGSSYIASSGTEIDCIAKIYINGTKYGQKQLSNSYNSSDSRLIITNSVTGTASAEIASTTSGTRIYTEGCWFIYNGSTYREITHV